MTPTVSQILLGTLEPRPLTEHLTFEGSDADGVLCYHLALPHWEGGVYRIGLTPHSQHVRESYYDTPAELDAKWDDEYPSLYDWYSSFDFSDDPVEHFIGFVDALLCLLREQQRLMGTAA